MTKRGYSLKSVNNSCSKFNHIFAHSETKSLLSLSFCHFAYLYKQHIRNIVYVVFPLINKFALAKIKQNETKGSMKAKKELVGTALSLLS